MREGEPICRNAPGSSEGSRAGVPGPVVNPVLPGLPELPLFFHEAPGLQDLTLIGELIWGEKVTPRGPPRSGADAGGPPKEGGTQRPAQETPKSLQEGPVEEERPSSSPSSLAVHHGECFGGGECHPLPLCSPAGEDRSAPLQTPLLRSEPLTKATSGTPGLFGRFSGYFLAGKGYPPFLAVVEGNDRGTSREALFVSLPRPEPVPLQHDQGEEAASPFLPRGRGRGLPSLKYCLLRFVLGGSEHVTSPSASLLATRTHAHTHPAAKGIRPIFSPALSSRCLRCNCPVGAAECGGGGKSPARPRCGSLT